MSERQHPKEKAHVSHPWRKVYALVVLILVMQIVMYYFFMKQFE
jgi:hypothetical protein